MNLLFIILIPLIASLLSSLTQKSMRVLYFIAASAAVFEFLAVTAVTVSVVYNGAYVLDGYLAVDALGAIVIMLVAIVGMMASWYSIGYLKTEVEKKIIGFHRVRQYFVLLHLFLLAMFCAITTTNPILMWVAIEATTLATAFLISFYNKPSAMEAAWKYLIINSVGLLLGFFGTLLFLYPIVQAGFHGLSTWDTLIAYATAANPFIVKIAFIFTLIGYGTKVGFAPMHTWRPDAYSKTPTAIVALLSGALLNVAFLAILRFKSVTDLVIGKEFSGNLLIFFGLISIVLAAFNIFNQKNYKRLLAYSSIEHAGIMALGFGFSGAGVFAALLHMVYHSLTKTIMFLSAGNILLKYSSTKIKNIKGLLSALPITSILFITGFLAITGVPPFGIFITEFSILAAGIQAHPVVVVIALLAFALVFVGFLRHVSAMAFGENESPLTKGENGFWTTAPIIIIAILLTLLSFFIPASMQSLLQSAAATY